MRSRQHANCLQTCTLQLSFASPQLQHFPNHGAEVSTGGGTPADFGAADSQGRLRLPGYPPTFFVTMQARRACA